MPLQEMTKRARFVSEIYLEEKTQALRKSLPLITDEKGEGEEKKSRKERRQNPSFA